MNRPDLNVLFPDNPAGDGMSYDIRTRVSGNIREHSSPSPGENPL
jgi:hypothetical protein